MTDDYTPYQELPNESEQAISAGCCLVLAEPTEETVDLEAMVCRRRKGEYLVATGMVYAWASWFICRDGYWHNGDGEPMAFTTREAALACVRQWEELVRIYKERK